MNTNSNRVRLPNDIATGIISYIENGKHRKWSVGCMCWETDQDLKEHLSHWKPKAKFISAQIIPDTQRNHK